MLTTGKHLQTTTTRKENISLAKERVYYFKLLIGPPYTEGLKWTNKMSRLENWFQGWKLLQNIVIIMLISLFVITDWYILLWSDLENKKSPEVDFVWYIWKTGLSISLHFGILPIENKHKRLEGNWVGLLRFFETISLCIYMGVYWCTGNRIAPDGITY